MRITKGFLTCVLLMASTVNASSLEELAGEVNALPSYESQLESMTVVKDIDSTELSKFVYNVGLDVSNLSENQVTEIESDFGDKPFWSFCDEHDEVEIVMTGNSLWERTKLMKLQRTTDITFIH
ncbi:hypothetical protein A143_17720 [Vibrio splendidus ZS-139]|nr:hypothetical protein A143_17720 [Vibrio splendidus ZS-139]